MVGLQPSEGGYTLMAECLPHAQLEAGKWRLRLVFFCFCVFLGGLGSVRLRLVCSVAIEPQLDTITI